MSLVVRLLNLTLLVAIPMLLLLILLDTTPTLRCPLLILLAAIPMLLLVTRLNTRLNPECTQWALKFPSLSSTKLWATNSLNMDSQARTLQALPPPTLPVVPRPIRPAHLLLTLPKARFEIARI